LALNTGALGLVLSQGDAKNVAMKQACCTFVGIIVLTAGCGPSSKPQAPGPQSAAAEPETKPAKEQGLQTRLEWNRSTLVADYERYGNRNAKWDAPASKALEAFAQLRSAKGPQEREQLFPKLIDAASCAMTNGCTDPMIRYLHARFVMPELKHEPQQHIEAYTRAAEELTRSSRAPIRKYYAALRASASVNEGSASSMPEVHKWRDQAKRFLAEVVHDQTTPAGEVFDAWEAFFDAVPKNSKEHFEFYLSLEPTMLQNWASAPELYMLKGWFYADYAWQARGSGWSDSVTAKGWEGFEQRLAIAEKALDKAWKLDPTDARTARHMLTVELGQGRGRQEMEKWFERAMVLNTNYYDACHAKLYYLEPKWYGSQEDMLEFASECLRSEKWGGNVPLIVLDAHEGIVSYLDKSERPGYWKRSEVWGDVKQAFDKFFRLNPDASGWHHNYALYAYRAEQWDELNRQLKLLGPVNYSYFGGKEAFDKMALAAKEHSAKAN
jgi:hypothetical protein